MFALLFLILLAVSSFYTTSVLSIVLWVFYTLCTIINIGSLLVKTNTELEVECVNEYRYVRLSALFLACGLVLAVAYMLFTSGVGWLSIIMSLNIIVTLWKYNTGYKIVNSAGEQ